MGVLNVAPDSFSDGGTFLDVDAAISSIDDRYATLTASLPGTPTRPSEACLT